MAPATPPRLPHQPPTRSPIARKSLDSKASRSAGLVDLSKPALEDSTMADDVLDPLLTTPRPPFDAESYLHHHTFPLALLPQLPATDTLLYLDPLLSAAPIRVSSQLLRATNSPVLLPKFKPTYQYRILRRKKLLQNGLPLGIGFVVDLSPPDDGDEAVKMQEIMYVPEEVREWENQDVKVVRWEEPDCGEIDHAPGATPEEPKWDAEQQLSKFRQNLWGGTMSKNAKFGAPVGPPSLQDTAARNHHDDSELQALIQKRDEMARRAIEFEQNTSGANAKFMDLEERKATRAAQFAAIEEVKKQINDWQIKIHGKGSELGCLECAEIEKKKAPKPSPKEPESPPRKKPLEYSLPRHLSALERVLALITHNLDPHLHSATMWYTFFLTARDLELLHVPAIVDTVLGWLYRPGNYGFVEKHTELCFQLADELRAPMLLKECFALSVARGRPFNETNPYWSAMVVARGSFFARHAAAWDRIMAPAWLHDTSIVPEQAVLNELIIGAPLGSDVRDAAKGCRNIIDEVAKREIKDAIDDIWNDTQPNSARDDPSAWDILKTNKRMWTRLANIKIPRNVTTRRQVAQIVYGGNEQFYETHDRFAEIQNLCRVSVQCVAITDETNDLNLDDEDSEELNHHNLRSKRGYKDSADEDNSFNEYLEEEYADFKIHEGYIWGKGPDQSFSIGEYHDSDYIRDTLVKLRPLTHPPTSWPPPLPDPSLVITTHKGNKCTIEYSNPVSVTTLNPTQIFGKIQNHIQSIAKPILGLDSDYDGQWSDQALLGGLTDEEWKYLPSWAFGGGVEPDEILGKMMMRVGGGRPTKDDGSAWSIEGDGRTEAPSGTEKSWSRIDSESEHSFEFGVMSEDGFGSEIGEEERRVWEKMKDGEVVRNWGVWGRKEHTLGSEMFDSREGTEVGYSDDDGDDAMTEVGSGSEVADDAKTVMNDCAGEEDKMEWDEDEDEEWDDSNFE